MTQTVPAKGLGADNPESRELCAAACERYTVMITRQRVKTCVDEDRPSTDNSQIAHFC